MALMFWKHFQMMYQRAHTWHQRRLRKRPPHLPSRPFQMPQLPQLGEGAVWPTLLQRFAPGKMMSATHLQSRTVYKNSLVPLVYPSLPLQAEHLPASIAAVFSRKPQAVPKGTAMPLSGGARLQTLPVGLRSKPPRPALRPAPRPVLRWVSTILVFLKFLLPMVVTICSLYM